MAPPNALDSDNPDGDDESSKASKLAARSARFNQVLVGNKYKELEEARVQERKGFENQGLIKTGKTELGDAVDMRGSCVRMCSDYEREFREYTREVHHFEERAGDSKRMDPEKAVAAYTRSDAGAGLGDAAILPSDLRTPATLVRTLDYLINHILPTPPTQGPPTPRRALGNSAGFIRDRTRAIRKEFAMQSAWGHDDAINTFERIARWHILCLRELQEEGGMNTDMHIDSAELGRCFTSLRQQYNDRREVTGLELPCANEPEFRAYMLIFDLTSKSVSIPTAELPTVILDHPLVKLAWSLRQAAQRNFDSQKEGSKLNAELGMNAINRYLRILRDGNLPFLFACLVEVRLREMRRSALRAMTRTYPRLRGEPVRLNEMGEVVERKMVLVEMLAGSLGCEEQEEEESAWDDVASGDQRKESEVVKIARKFDLDVYEDDTGPVGVVINLASPFNDNRDAPYTKRWKSITAKRGEIAYADIVNGNAGVHIDGTPATVRKIAVPASVESTSTSLFSRISAGPKVSATPSSSFGKPRDAGIGPPRASPVIAPQVIPIISPAGQTASPGISVATPAAALPPAKSSFFSSFLGTGKSTGDSSRSDTSQTATSPAPAAQLPSFTFTAPTPPTSLDSTTSMTPPLAPLFSKPSFFSTPAVAGPSSPPKVTPQPKIPNLGQSSSTSNVQSPPPHVWSSGPTQNAIQAPLSSSLSRSTRKVSYYTHERTRHRAQIPHITNDLINAAIQQLLDGMTSDFLRLVKQEKAAREYSRKKELRKVEIARMSDRVFEKMRGEVVEGILEEALSEELRRRSLVRSTGRRWNRLARQRREEREEIERMREETFERMLGLGLGGSSTGNLRVEDGLAGRDEDRLEEFEVDVALQQAERNKDHFFSPTTFLSTLANHVAPLLSASTYRSISGSSSSSVPADSSSSSSKRFHTLLSVPSSPANRPDEAASRWLEGKFKPRSGLGGDAEEDEDEEGYESGGARFTVGVLDRFEETAGTGAEWTGLCVFVAPLRGDEEDCDSNIQDAQDRMAVLARVAMGRDARYTLGLLVIAWEDEALSDVIARLQLEDDAQYFTNISLLTLERPEDLDLRFGRAVELSLPEIGEKVQLVIRLKDVLGRLLPVWQRYLDISRVVGAQRPSDAPLSLALFRHGIEGVNEVGQTVKAVLNGAQIIPASRIGLTILPDVPSKDVTSNNEVIEVIEDYLDTDIFKGVSDLFLSVTPLRQASLTGQALPITPLLSAIARLILSDLISQTILLKAFYTPPLPAHILQGLLNNMAKLYESHINGYIGMITQLPPSPANSPSKEVSRGVKRDRREDERESKASKNARLKRALEEVERTLGGVDMDGSCEMGVVM